MNRAVLVNGVATTLLDVADRGLAYGDGVFRTLRCDGGKLLHWPRHYTKLQANCAALGIVCPAAELWLADLRQLAPHDAVVKLTVTRGLSARGYAVDASQTATRISQISALPAYAPQLANEGVVVRHCDWRLSLQPQLAGVKHLNRLDQVMARREWSDSGIFDGLMLNARGELVEGVISNLFLLRDQVLLTHPLLDCGVAGVTRQRVLDCAAELGIACAEVALSVDDLYQADEVMLCNSLFGLVPIRLCLATAGRPEQRWENFAVTARLQMALRQMDLRDQTALFTGSLQSGEQ